MRSHRALLLALLGLFLAPVAHAETKPAEPGKSGPPKSELRKVVAAGAKLIDVRTPEEYAAGHIEGAINLPISELPQRLAEVGPRDKPVVVYCSAGGRSARAEQILKSNGWKTVYNLGAMSNW